MPSASRLPVHVCGHALGSPRHLCCFFDSKDQRYEALLPTFQEGLEQEEEVVCITEADFAQEHRARLSAHGIDVAHCERQGQLRTLTSDETYLSGGRFDKSRMYDVLEDCLARMRSSRYRGIRACGDMEWALQNFPGTDQLMEYESEVNRLLTGQDDTTFICIYDANRISGRAMLDLLSTHSHVVIGTDVHENPYYMAADDYRRTFLDHLAHISVQAG
jgi:hypothetical protein